MDDSKLIQLVREHPSLYNPKHPEYKDANVRDTVWVEVARSLKQPVEECKQRWRNIRDAFTRRKRNKKLSTGSARSKKLRKWYLEVHLEFLNHIECEKETLTNTATREKNDYTTNYESQQTEEVEMEGEPADLENDTSETSTETNNIDANIAETLTEQQAQRTRHTIKNSLDNIVELFKKNSEVRAKLLSTVLAKQTEEHPIDSFFKSMAMSVKKLSPANQISAKMQICQIVGQLELNENSTRSSSALVSTNCDLNTPRQTEFFSSQTSPAFLPDNELQVMTTTTVPNFS